MLAGYLFTPPSRSYTNVQTAQTMQGYTAARGVMVAGTVTEHGVGVAGVTMAGLPASLVTDSLGRYAGTVEPGWSGTVTPTLAGYTFTPASRTYSSLQVDQTGQSYTAVGPVEVSGTVLLGTSGLAGVTMAGLPGNPVTDSDGHYTATVPPGWSGTVTPTLAGYSFTPPTRTYSNLEADRVAEDYTAVGPVSVSGTVTLGGSGLAGVTMAGLPGRPVTDAQGHYTAVVTYGWSGTATPTLAGYSFTPSSRTYSNLTSNRKNQDYTSVWSVNVSGIVTLGGVGLPGVTMSGLPGSPVTDGQGHYTAPLTLGWSGTATPTLAHHAFTPPSRTYTNVTTAQSGQDYVAVKLAAISGTVTLGGAGLQGVTIAGLPGNPVTDAAGHYSVTVEAGWSGTATPSLAGHAFTPPARVYTSVQVDQADQDYSARTALTVCGTVAFSGAGLPGVTIAGLPGNPVTDAAGNYCASVPVGWSGTATPTLAGYSFTPPSRGFTALAADQAGQDFSSVRVGRARRGLRPGS
jgi:hypothetical protein